MLLFCLNPILPIGHKKKKNPNVIISIEYQVNFLFLATLMDDLTKIEENERKTKKKP